MGMKFILLVFFFLSLPAFAQETLDVRFLNTQRSSGSPFSLPVSINSDGEISLFGSNGTDQLSFQPVMQMDYRRVHIEYSQPIVLNRLHFYRRSNDFGWIEVRRRQWEVGLGLSAILKSSTTIGLAPYKGAITTLIHFKASKDQPSLPFRMPQELKELEAWTTEDSGTFQTYGGVTLYAGFSAGIVSLATAEVGIQNQFLIEMKKLSKDEIVLKLSEEDLKRRQFTLGPVLASGTAAHFSGKRFTAEFHLNLTNPSHHDLFKEALKGNLSLLQRTLAHEDHKLSWVGNDKYVYLGIPGVIGKEKNAGHYDLEEDGQETQLDFRGEKNRGILTPLRNHRDFVYASKEGMVIVWSSEMNKAGFDVVEKRFLSKGRILGVKSFDHEVPEDTKFGSVVSQIGISFTRKEIESLQDIDLEDVKKHFVSRCEKEILSCRKEKKVNKIMNRVSDLLGRPWEDMKKQMGLLLIEQPALIYAMMKVKNAKKDVYFKFLSENFQSLEGSAPVEL